MPVYPRQSPVVFNPLPPGPPQSWSSNPFGGVEPRPAPTLARRPPRILLPKGKSVPRAAPVDAFDGGDLIPSRGRKRALSPDARAAAREVRIMHACGRCHKKRAKVRVQLLTAHQTTLIQRYSVERPGPVSHV